MQTQNNRKRLYCHCTFFEKKKYFIFKRNEVENQNNIVMIKQRYTIKTNIYISNYINIYLLTISTT